MSTLGMLGAQHHGTMRRMAQHGTIDVTRPGMFTERQLADRGDHPLAVIFRDGTMALNEAGAAMVHNTDGGYPVLFWDGEQIREYQP